MSNALSAHLISIILAMTRADKRRFTLYCSRQQKGDGKKYLDLFDYLNKNKKWDQADFISKNKHIKPHQLSNLKRNLFDHILITLKMGEQDKDHTIQVRERINQGKTLFNLGLYQQSLWVLHNAKEKAKKWNLPVLELDIVDLEKKVELHFVTGRPSTTAKQLNIESKKAVKKVSNEQLLSGVALHMYGYFVEKGYIKNETEANQLNDLMRENKKQIPSFTLLQKQERLYYHQAHFWYFYCMQDFLSCYRYAFHWVYLLEKTAQQHIHAAQYLKGLNSLLASLFRLNHIKPFYKTLLKLEEFGNRYDAQLNRNEKTMLFKYTVVHTLNGYFMSGDFEIGISEIAEIESQLEEKRPFLDQRFINSVYYKIASLYFGFGDFNNASKYLNKILYKNYSPLREDIQSFSRILLTVCYFEMNDEHHLSQSIKSTYHYLGKRSELNMFQKEIFSFLRKTSSISKHKLKDHFKDLLQKMVQISKVPYQQRPFYYFDIISWLESKLERKKVSEIIKSRGLGHQKLFD